MKSMKCPKCDFTILENASICKNCKFSFSTVSRSCVNNDQKVYLPNNQSQPKHFQSSANSKDKEYMVFDIIMEKSSSGNLGKLVLTDKRLMFLSCGKMKESFAAIGLGLFGFLGGIGGDYIKDRRIDNMMDYLNITALKGLDSFEFDLRQVFSCEIMLRNFPISSQLKIGILFPNNEINYFLFNIMEWAEGDFKKIPTLIKQQKTDLKANRVSRLYLPEIKSTFLYQIKSNPQESKKLKVIINFINGIGVISSIFLSIITALILNDFILKPYFPAVSEFAKSDIKIPAFSCIILMVIYICITYGITGLTKSIYKNRIS